MIDRCSLRTIATMAAATALLACGKKAPPPTPAVPVTVGKAELRTVPYVLQTNGMVEPMQTVAIEPQVGGIITKILFKEGDDVKAGQPLFEIDTRSYQATLDQAEAVVERDRAQLASAKLRCLALRRTRRQELRHVAADGAGEDHRCNAQGDARIGSGRGAAGAAQLSVRDHPLADLRTRRQSAGSQRLSRQSPRLDAARARSTRSIRSSCASPFLPRACSAFASTPPPPFR